MPDSLKARTRHTLMLVIALAPWVIAMYAFYWLDSSGTWTSETAHRGKLSVAILSAGMISSFLAWSHFAKHKRK